MRTTCLTNEPWPSNQAEKLLHAAKVSKMARYCNCGKCETIKQQDHTEYIALAQDFENLNAGIVLRALVEEWDMGKILMAVLQHQ